jgi:hypothetical protein
MTISVELVPLAPRGWKPNPYITGGNLPWQTLYIPYDHWKSVGEPQNIEDYYDSVRQEVAPNPATHNYRGFINP